MATYSSISEISTPQKKTTNGTATDNFTTPLSGNKSPSTLSPPSSLPKLDTSTLSPSGKKKAKSKRYSKVAEMQEYLKQLEKSHAETRSVVESITGLTPERSKKQDPKRRQRRRSTHTFDEPTSPKKVSPSHKMWVESLERMRPVNTTKPGTKIGNPLKRRASMVPVNDEHHRLAKRLATLDFPVEACVEALHKTDMDIKKAVDILLEWYPKGSGGRNAVQKLLKVLLGAENKLTSMKERLEGLYSEGGIDGIKHPGLGSPSGQSAAATIFKQFDTDNSGHIEPSEFKAMMNGIGVFMTDDEFREAITFLDEDGNGKIELDEFAHWWGKQTGASFKEMNSIDITFDHVEKEASKKLNAEKVFLYLNDSHTSKLWIRRSAGHGLTTVPPGQSIAHHVIVTGKVIKIADVSKDVRAIKSQARYADVKNLIAHPIFKSRKKQEIIGVIEVHNKVWGTPFSDMDSDALRKICSQIRVGVLKCLQSLLQGSPVKPSRRAGLPTVQGASKSPYVLADPFDRRQTFDVSQMKYGQNTNYLKIGNVNNYRKNDDSSLLPSTMSKLKDLIEEYNEENGVTSPSQVVDRHDINNTTDKYYTTERESVVVHSNNNNGNNKKTSGKYTVNSKNNDDNNNRSDVQDLMARMRKIEGDKNR